MSLSHEVTIWCDGEVEGGICGQWQQACGTAKALRRELRAKGWARRDDTLGDEPPGHARREDCPECGHEAPGHARRCLSQCPPTVKR